MESKVPIDNKSDTTTLKEGAEKNADKSYTDEVKPTNEQPLSSLRYLVLALLSILSAGS